MNILTSCAAALGSAALLTKLGVPAGAMLGAMIGVACHNMLIQTATTLPKGVEFLTYAALGWLIGQGFTRETASTLRGVVLPVCLIVGLMLLSTALITLVVYRMGHLDQVTAFLSASPGALSSMAAISRATGGDTVVIVTIHTVRVFAVLAIAPLIARLIQ